MYHGMSKPDSVNEFLAHFVNEFIFLSKNDLTVCNNKYIVSINAILCDASTRSFITYTKGHTRYFSCSKCIQEGDFVQNRVIFPETNILRTDNSFKNQIQPEHHTDNFYIRKPFNWNDSANPTRSYASRVPRCHETFIAIMAKKK